MLNRSRSDHGEKRSWLRKPATKWLVAGLILLVFVSTRKLSKERPPWPPMGLAGSNLVYTNYTMHQVPWSIHVVRIPRQAFEIRTMHAKNAAIGLGTVSAQVALADPAHGRPVAAMNGDFYLRDSAYAGDPRGLQITDGELISAPSGAASFWLDASGTPHATNAVSMFKITWPNGAQEPFDLNGRRRPDGVELYTPAAGSSTHTTDGLELVLESSESGPWLPLRPGFAYKARVREVLSSGNTAIQPDTMVLSLSRAKATKHRGIQPGDIITLSTDTQPSLKYVPTAIGGGPLLLHHGKQEPIKIPDSDSFEYTSMLERHPRSAVGWNDSAVFLVEVDGRQRRLSVGMTLEELSSLLLHLGCKEAMNLDGGGSATLWFQGKVRNRPCDGSERAIANSLQVFAKKSDVSPAPEAAAGK